MCIKKKLNLLWSFLVLAVATAPACTPAHIVDIKDRDAGRGGAGQGTGGSQSDGGLGGAGDTGTGGQAGVGQGTGGIRGAGGAGTGGQADAGQGTGGVQGAGGTGTGGDNAVDASADASDAADVTCGVSCSPSTFRVLRLGDGKTALSSAAAPVFIDERGLDGTLLGTIALPTAAAGNGHPLTMSGTATSEGALSLSADGQFLTLAGYSAPPDTGSVASSAAATFPRVVGRIDASGAVDTSTLLATAFDGNNVRAATSVDGTAFWAAGSGSTTGGIWYIALGATGGVRVLANPTAVRVVDVAGGQLYASSNSGTFADVFTVGSGLPTTVGQVATSLSGMSPSGAPSPFAFVFFDLSPTVAGVDTVYVADDRAPPTGGIQKWAFDGTNWMLVTTFGVTQNPTGFRGLTGFASSTGVTLIGSTAEASANRVVVFVDDGVAAPSSTVIATATASTILRGVALSPGLR